MKDFQSINMILSLFMDRTQISKVFNQFITMIFVLTAVSSANAQIIDYENYVKLDSIVYPIYPYGPADYKYEYSYDEDGNQIGFVRYNRNQEYDNQNIEFRISSNGDITNFNNSRLMERGTFSHNAEGKLIEAYRYEPFCFYGCYSFSTTRTFDNLGRPLVFSRVEQVSEDNYYSIADTCKYFNNGKLQEHSKSYQNYYYDIDWINEEFVRVYDHSDELKYTFDYDGHLVSEIDIIHMPADSVYFDMLDTTYNITVIFTRETLYQYDANSRLVSSLERWKQSLSQEDPDFINSLGWQDEYGNGETGEEVYNREFNVWSESAPIKYDTKDTYDDNGRLVLRKTVDASWGDTKFTEEFSYDNNGNVISRKYKSSVSVTETHFYDENNRLTNESLFLSDDCIYQFEYWYDEAGQKHVKEERKSKTMSEPSSVKEYDNKGNLVVEIATTSGHTNRYEYTYDSQNNMTSVTRYQDGDFEEKIEYDTTIPSFKSGGTVDIVRNMFWINDYELRQAKYTDSHLFYLFDQPFKVKSYKYFDMGEVREVQLYYSKFIDESAIENTTIEEEALPDYYNLEGRKIASPMNGITIMKRGGKVTKQFKK